MGDSIKDFLMPGRAIAKAAGIYTPASDRKTNINEEKQEQEASDAADLLETNELESSRRKRNAIFQSSKGSGAMLEGSGVLNVGARDTYYGN